MRLSGGRCTDYLLMNSRPGSRRGHGEIVSSPPARSIQLQTKLTVRPSDFSLVKGPDNARDKILLSCAAKY